MFTEGEGEGDLRSLPARELADALVEWDLKMPQPRLGSGRVPTAVQLSAELEGVADREPGIEGGVLGNEADRSSSRRSSDCGERPKTLI